MYTVQKKDMEQWLQQLGGEFCEIFLESSKAIHHSFVNGIWKTPKIVTRKGSSLLARSEKKEYFTYFQGHSSIPHYIEIFTKKYPTKEKRAISLQWNDMCILHEPKEFPLEWIFSCVQEGYETILKRNPYIQWVEVTFSFVMHNFLVWNSYGNFVSDSYTYTSLYIEVFGKRKTEEGEEIVGTEFEKITGTGIEYTLSKKDIFKAMKKINSAIVEQLYAEKSPSGIMDVVIGNEAWGTIIHEAVGHGLEGDLLHSSVYKDLLGKQVAHETVTLIENPTIPYLRGYYRYDHEGTPAQYTYLIKDGILVSYLHNIKTASQFQTQSTWHGRRQNYKHKTLVRMGNTYVAPGTNTKQSLIKQVKHGIYVSKMGGWQVNTITGDFVFEVKSWYLIENGNIVRSIRWSTIMGNWPKMLVEIKGIANDLLYFDNGTCGKWQYVPVSDGCPTILTTLKVSSI